MPATMTTEDIRDRIDTLEAKAYFEYGLSSKDSDELDGLIAYCKQNEVDD